MVAFTVHGIPAPQGSKNQWGSEANPRTRPWRAAVSAQAAETMNGPLLDGPVQVKVEFVFTRPKTHYGTGKNAGVLKGDVSEYVARTPDVDKLARAVLDALSGICFRDDAQVAHLNVWKRYGPSAQARVQVETLVDRPVLGVASVA